MPFTQPQNLLVTAPLGSLRVIPHLEAARRLLQSSRPPFLPLLRCHFLIEASPTSLFKAPTSLSISFSCFIFLHTIYLYQHFLSFTY